MKAKTQNYEFDGVNWIEIVPKFDYDLIYGYEACPFTTPSEIYCPYLPVIKNEHDGN